MPEETEELMEQTIEEQEPITKKKKQKKVVRRRKSKKEKEKPLTSAIRLTVEGGKVEFGSRKGIKASLLGKAKLFVLAANAPEPIRESVNKFSKISEIPVIEFDGNSLELGSVCGKPFPVCVLSVYDEGTSQIMKLK
jgi:large subunit ribosomal protein L30e